MILFIQSYLSGDYVTLFFKLKYVMIMWFIVLIAIIIDFIAGIHKAKQLGEVRTSHGFKRTVSKLVLYYGLLTFAFMFDVLASIFEPLPYFTTLAALFLLFIEGKSVFEKASEKDRRKLAKDTEVIKIFLEHKDDILGTIVEIYKKEQEKEQDETEENKEN